MSKSHMPGADRTTQYWAGKFVGSKMNTNCACLHTTETGNAWPGYGGGASAPHMTIRPNIKARTVSIRQHFPADRSSRALVNLAGGVETNTLNVFQIELVGTCDSKYRKSRKEWGAAGVDYIYWPDAPDWLLKAIAPVFQWLDAEWPDFTVADAAPRGWVAYPASYGLKARQRMTFAEWRNAYGIFGHQHVPENTHGDPGNFPIARLIAAIKGESMVTPAPPAPTKPPAEKPITRTTHTVVKGDTLAAIARRSGKTVADLTAWNDLEDPARISIGQQLRLTPPEPETVPVTLLYGNLAGYNADTAPGVTRWKQNADGFAALVKKRKPAIVATVEESNRKQNKMRPRIDAALGKDYTRMAGGSDGRYWRRRAGAVKALGSWVFETTHRYRGDDKQMACFAFEASKVKGLVGVFHAEHESGADQVRVDQALEFWDHLALQAKSRSIDERNVFMVGDSNSESWVADALTKRGVKILARANFVGWDRRSKKPFNVLAGKGSATDVESLTTGFSDHQFIAATLQLVA